MRARFYDGSGAELIARDGVVDVPENLDTTWHKRSGTVVVPQVAATLRVELSNERNSGWVTGALALGRRKRPSQRRHKVLHAWRAATA